jgi:hypothetical protein
VRGPRHIVRRGKTPVLDPAEARQLIDAIDTTTIIGLRDRALIGRRESDRRRPCLPDRPSDRNGSPAQKMSIVASCATSVHGDAVRLSFQFKPDGKLHRHASSTQYFRADVRRCPAHA